MKIYEVYIPYGLATVVAESAEQVVELMNNDDYIFDEVSLADVTLVEQFDVTGGEPSIISCYQE